VTLHATIIERLRLVLISILGWTLVPYTNVPTFAANTDLQRDATTVLTDLSLDELMKIEVTSVAKHAQPLQQAAAAVFVISQEDIRRSGVTTIPEALRMAPGIEVARIDAHRWAISSRGFNEEFANKLLILVDGRTVYSPLISGVFWDVQDTLLEDIDRIEVIRGPGASLWGTNAVNGVINVITKKASDTQGFLAVAGAGTEERGFTSLRYGGSLGDQTHFRIYGKFFERDNFARQSGAPALDNWRNTRGGFRLDHTPSSQDDLTVQGEYYNGSEGLEFSEPILTAPYSQLTRGRWTFAGGHLRSRWAHRVADNSSLIVQAYYDRSDRESALFTERRNTVDFDAQHSFAVGSSHLVVWGLGYRFTHDHIVPSTTIRVSPTDRGLSFFTGFLQDEISLIPHTLAFIPGTKIEHNDFTGWTIQPSGRVRWTPRQNLTIWGAVSRSVRTPSRAEFDGMGDRQTLPPNTLFPGAPVALVSVAGSRRIQNESLMAYELGLRYQPADSLSIDVTAFYNRHSRLRSLEPETPALVTTSFPPHVVIPFTTNNKLSAEAYGIEVSSDWRPLEWWRLQATYSFLTLHMITGDSLDPDGRKLNGQSPSHHASLRSLMRLPGNVEFDLWGRYVDRLPTLNIQGYFNLDLRLGWKPLHNLDLSVVGQNLIDSHRPEFNASFLEQGSSEVQRGAYVKLTWQY